jgi:hypothetical protein
MAELRGFKGQEKNEIIIKVAKVSKIEDILNQKVYR